MSFDRAVLGDNQFLGVNHASQARAAELYERFRNPDAILSVIGAAYEAGVRDFMFTTHDRYEPVFDEIRRSNLFPGLHYSPCLPYAHKYWDQLSSKGAVGFLGSTLSRINAFSLVPTGVSLAFGRTRRIVSLLTGLELAMCRDLPLRAVFLQNAATDFLLSMELDRQLAEFAEAVTRLGAEPGFITMNHPLAAEVLTGRIGLDRPWLCANYNCGGFRMNPSQAAVERSFASGRTRNMAMSVFASGNASPKAALGYLSQAVAAGSVSAVLFGSANPAHIRHNVETITAMHTAGT
mgnify:FL=1